MFFPLFFRYASSIPGGAILELELRIERRSTCFHLWGDRTIEYSRKQEG
jgi:hypothetical protein